MSTREEIFEAAAKIFSEKGYHATSMQDIATAVHLKKGSLYHHVSSKQEILLELLERALKLLISRLEGVLEEGLPPEETLQKAMTVYLRILTENRALSSVLLFEHRSLKPTLQTKHISQRDRFEELWRRIIQAGTASGDFQPVDADQVVRGLLGALNWTVTWYRPEGALSSDEIVDHYIDLFLTGLKKPTQVEMDDAKP